MRTISTSITVGLLAILAVVVVWLSYRPAAAPMVPATRAAEPAGPVLRFGLVPERDVFAQRRAYQQLADYLAGKISIRVELATVNSYRAVLDDFHESHIDAAFLGSLVTVLAVEREAAVVTCKPEYEGGISTYRGVIFVRPDSPIKTIDDLAGHSLGIVRTTTGGNLFPVWRLMQHQLLDSPKAPHFVWIGTHDDVMLEVAAGHVDAGAAKNLRLDAYEKRPDGMKFRRLDTSDPVPENALVWRHDVPTAQRQAVVHALMQMKDDEAGKQVLATLKMTGFIPCNLEEYHLVYQIVDEIGPAWNQIGIDGPPPKRTRSSATAPVSEGK